MRRREVNSIEKGRVARCTALKGMWVGEGLDGMVQFLFFTKAMRERRRYPPSCESEVENVYPEGYCLYWRVGYTIRVSKVSDAFSLFQDYNS